MYSHARAELAELGARCRGSLDAATGYGVGGCGRQTFGAVIILNKFEYIQYV